jgi:hypothetical protein
MQNHQYWNSYNKKWDVKEWKKEIEKRVRICGLRVWKEGLEIKDSLKLYRMKEMS